MINFQKNMLKVVYKTGLTAQKSLRRADAFK